MKKICIIFHKIKPLKGSLPNDTCLLANYARSV